MKSSEVSIKIRSTPASLSFKGQVTRHTTVKWSIAEIRNDLCCKTLCNNDKRHDGGKDLPFLSFPRDKQKRKRKPPLECTIFEYNVYARPAWFEIQNGGCLIRV